MRCSTFTETKGKKVMCVCKCKGFGMNGSADFFYTAVEYESALNREVNS